MINKTQLNKLRSQINKNKLFLDTVKSITGDDDKKFSMALSMTVLMEYLGLNQTNSLDAITDNGGDNKIDAFYYSDDEDELTELIIIQSKFKNIDGETGTFEEDEIKLCITNCKKFLRGEDFQTTNEKLKKKMTDYRILLNNNGRPSISIKLFFATNGIIHEGHKKLKEVIDCQDENIVVSFIDASMYGKQQVLEKAELNVNIKSSEDKTDSIFSIEDELYAGKIVSCSIKELMLFYEKSGERLLLSNNVRYLVKTSNINKEIKSSFINDPKRFCYLNNGITIISSEYAIKPTGHNVNKVELTKPNIVNGGQTVASLYQLYLSKYEEYKEQFDNAKILIRIYKAPKEYSITIAKATNSQNAISVVDLRSNDAPQEVLKNYLAKFGVGLISKIGEDISYYDDTITNENILQLYASLYCDDPAKAKTSKAAIFKKYYGDVFNNAIDEPLCMKLYRCYQVSRFILSQTSEDKVVIQNAFYSIIYSMKKYNVNIINENIPEAQIKAHFESAFKSSMALVHKIILQKQLELKTKFSMNNLFKGNEIKDLIDLGFDEEMKVVK
ncbi:MAG: AIPR family protein [Bacteroidetes bacterium]|nr:AIPR family protein [Bacteroidota bacterium]